MWATRYFTTRYWPSHYFAPTGAPAVVEPFMRVGAVRLSQAGLVSVTLRG